MAKFLLTRTSSKTIDRPNCPACKTPMWLATIEPEKPDYDRRTFECPVCEHSASWVVKFR
ncbi:MAG: hypothetical protein ACR2K5_07675 [Pseudolabrys sp.]